MAKQTDAKAQAILARCAAIDWRQPAHDRARILDAYQRWQAALGLARPIRLITDPVDVPPWPSRDTERDWDIARDGIGAFWMGFAGSPFVRMMSLTSPGAFPPVPQPDWSIAVAWACACALSMWQLDEQNEQDKSDFATITSALRRMAQRPATFRAMVLLETPFIGFFDPPPRIASIAADLMAASANEALWQHLAAREERFAKSLNLDTSGLTQPSERGEVIEALVSLTEPLLEACESGAFAHGYRDGEWIVLTAPAIWTDGRRLHRADGPAIAWPQTKVHAWKGCVLPDRFVKEPQTITADTIRGVTDARLQHALIDLYAHTHGHGRCMRDLGGVMVHEDDTGRLWCVNPRLYPLPAHGDDFRIVEVVNGTLERDGTRKTYWLRVPPAMQTARQAVAWTYGMTPGEYGRLVVRT